MSTKYMSGNADWYLSLFEQMEKNLNGESESDIHRLRQTAISEFTQNGYPTTKDEEWKYTDVRPISKINFAFSEECNISTAELDQYKIAHLDVYRIVFVNGNLQPQLSDWDESNSQFTIARLQDYVKENNQSATEFIAQYTPKDMDSFTALNTAFINDGIVILAPKNTVVDKPVHVLHINEGNTNTISAPRNLFKVEQGAQIEIIETYTGKGSKEYFTNVVTEIGVEANAKLEHYKIQTESQQAYHIGSVYIQQQRDSQYIAHNFTFGGKLVRNNYNAKLDGENINCVLNGLYLGSDKQHIDNHTAIDHAKPHCESDELYKGILNDHSNGVFNGKIFVRQDAQKTNAIQSNNTILLSDNANIDTKPQLEIFADDVRCTHGATVGQLDEEAYFYLRSRGIDKDQARQLLIFAFASDVIDRVALEPVRAQLAQLLAEKLHTDRPEIEENI
jgi:Fe-S cluster assembly protein SufD